MLSEKVIKQLISTTTFVNNASKLAYQLHLSRQDASEELLIGLLEHRLRKWSNDDLTLAIQRDLPSLKWRLKYSRKDLVRKSNKDSTRELEKAQMMAGMEPQASNEAETLKALERIKEIFKNANTRTWAESVLRVGKSETMVRFGQTPRQFNSKLAKVCIFARQHRQPNQSNSHNTKELHILSEWDDLMADQQTIDNDTQTFIGLHEDYINEIINSPQVAYQGRLIKDFSHAGKDKYVLVNLMTAREQQLDRRSNDNNE